MFDTIAGGLGIVVSSTVLAVVGLLAVRRYVSHNELVENHEVAGYVLSLIGTLYAVLLGLVVVDAMSKFQTAIFNVGQEAHSLADIFQLSNGFAEKERIAVHKVCLSYVDHVITSEWPAMSKGSYCPRAAQDTVDLWKTITDYVPQKENEKAIYSQILTETSNFADARRTRLVTSLNGVPQFLWLILLIGGVATVSFTYFFGLPNLPAQLVMVATTALLISLNLVILNFYGYPFSGDVHVGVDEFVRDKEIFERSLKTNNFTADCPSINPAPATPSL